MRFVVNPQAATLRVTLPARLQLDNDGSTDDDVSRSDYIRSGGFIDDRPPDDLDKIATFSFSEMELPGKIMGGLGGILLLTLIVYLIIA